MRDVHPPVSLTFGIAVGMGIAKNVVAIEIVVIHCLAIPTYGEPRSFCHGVVLRPYYISCTYQQDDKNEYFT